MSASTITIIETSGAKPKFYNTSNPTTEVVAKQMTASDLSKEIANNSPAGTYVDMNNAKHVRAAEQAAKVSAEAPYGAFEFRTTAAGKQELLVDGKVIFTALSFNLISDVDFYNKTNCWFFVVSDYIGSKEQYGVFALAVGNIDGKKVIENKLTMPYEYSFVSLHEGSVVKCITWSGASKYFVWDGRPFDITVKGGGLY